MRLYLASSLLALLAVTVFSSSSFAQLSFSEARQLGMELAWSSQIQLPTVGRGIVSSRLWADPTNSRQYAVVELADRTIRIAADQVDRKGNPIGLEEAKKLAGERAARLLGKTDGFEVVEVSVPAIKLVIVTNDGLVQTLDAETGSLLWNSSCGRPSAPAHSAALSPDGISVLHGEDLYLLNWQTGKHYPTKRLRYATSNAIAVCNGVAFVSDFNGRVQAYGLKERIPPWGYIVRGRAIGQPVTLADQSFSAIASREGYVYVFTVRETPAIWIRYQAPAAILGSLAAGNNAFYVGSEDGTLAKVSTEDRIGRIVWEHRTGQTISAPAFIAGNEAFLATEAGDIVAIDDESGLENWNLPGQRAVHIIGRAGGKIFFRTSSEEIAAADATTGQIIGKTSSKNLGDSIINQLDDRIYVASNNGRIQCLRPVGSTLPNLITAPMAAPEGSGETGIDEPPTTTTETMESTSPFEGLGTEAPAGGDPFGGADPFGTGAGGSGDTPADNPFGGDPFGGN